jgi:hypothetical protein
MSFALAEPINELTAERGIVAERMESNGYTRTVDFAPLVEKFALANIRRRCVMITGATGTGKTFAAKCASPDARKIEMAKMQSVELLADCEELCARNPLILLDDVGAELTVNNYGVKSEVFGTFVLAWYACEPRPRLIITTNMDSSTMVARFGDRVLSRLIGCCETYRMQGRDMRMNESCGADETPAVKKALREFGKDIALWGKGSVYPAAAYEYYCGKMSEDERRSLRRGIDRLMDGHQGCLRQTDGATIQDALADAVHAVTSGRA